MQFSKVLQGASPSHVAVILQASCSSTVSEARFFFFLCIPPRRLPLPHTRLYTITISSSSWSFREHRFPYPSQRSFICPASNRSRVNDPTDRRRQTTVRHMIALATRLVAIMLAFVFGFASIGAEALPEGIMPKRAVVGTGVSTSTSATPSSTIISSATPSATPSSLAPGSSTASSAAASTSKTSKNGGQTTSQQSASSQSQASQSQAPSSTSVPTTIAVKTTKSDGSVVTSSISTHTLVPDSSTSKTGAVQTESGSKHSVVKIGSSTIDPATLSHKTTIRTALVAHETRQSTVTSLYTSNGQTFSSVYSTENVYASTTGYATATIAPSLANGGGNGSNLSTHTKSIIGGVVGGIGGAILIGGLAFVAWRLWGKKKRQADAHDDWNDSQNDSVAQEKRVSSQPLSEYGSDGTERYFNPNRPVNTASNF